MSAAGARARSCCRGRRPAGSAGPLCAPRPPRACDLLPEAVCPKRSHRDSEGSLPLCPCPCLLPPCALPPARGMNPRFPIALGPRKLFLCLPPARARHISPRFPIALGSASRYCAEQGNRQPGPSARGATTGQVPVRGASKRGRRAWPRRSGSPAPCRRVAGAACPPVKERKRSLIRLHSPSQLSAFRNLSSPYPANGWAENFSFKMNHTPKSLRLQQIEVFEQVTAVWLLDGAQHTAPLSSTLDFFCCLHLVEMILQFM